jgi:hypothetical protein
MNKRFISAAVFLFGYLLILQPLFAVDGWKLIKNSSGIKVYERPVPGSDLMEYVGVTTIDAKIEVIGEVLRDVPRWNKWVTDCYGAQIEKKFDRNNFIMYLVLNPPLIEKRDIILKDTVVYDWDNARAVITLHSTDELKIPVEEGRIRVGNMSGGFYMDALGRFKTKCIYRLKVDPSGKIPKKMAYVVMKNYPYETLKDLKDMVGQKKYADLAKGTDEERQCNNWVASDAKIRRALTSRLTKFVRDKTALSAIISADRDGLRDIVSTGGSYASVEKATTDFFIKYFERFITDRKMQEKLKNDKELIAEMTEMVTTDCGSSDITLDSIMEKYSNR